MFERMIYPSGLVHLVYLVFRFHLPSEAVVLVTLCVTVFRRPSPKGDRPSHRLPACGWRDGRPSVDRWLLGWLWRIL